MHYSTLSLLFSSLLTSNSIIMIFFYEAIIHNSHEISNIFDLIYYVNQNRNYYCYYYLLSIRYFCYFEGLAHEDS